MTARTVDLVADAERTAAQLLRPVGSRWVHVQAVAATAEILRPAVRAEDGDILVAAAWLHDVGYAPELSTTGFHPLDGARYLDAEGFPSRVVHLVAHHSGALYEARERGLEGELGAYPCEEGR